MIHEIDESLKTLIKRDAVNGAGVDISFDAPTSDWAARRNTPTINVYLYDIQEDVDRRGTGKERVRDGDGVVVSRRPPRRRYKLSYLVTAWTQRPEDEHRLLSAVLACFIRHDMLPPEVVPEALNDPEYPVRVTIALPPSEDRNISDLWTALGGELKPSLDLVATAAIDSGRSETAGPPVIEGPVISMIGGEGQAEAARGRGRRGKQQDEQPAEVQAEEMFVPGGRRQRKAAGEKKAAAPTSPADVSEKGRVFRIRTKEPTEEQ